MFSRLEYHSSKCGSNLQTFKHDVPENIGLQISGNSRQQTPSMLQSWPKYMRQTLMLV